jgi:anti-anti-sigma factor
MRPLTTQPARRSAHRRLREQDSPAGSATTLALTDDCLLLRLADLRWHLDELLGDGPTTLVVDVTGLSQLSSATLAGLLWAQRRCQARGGCVVLRGADHRCRDKIARTGLGDVLPVVGDASTSVHGLRHRVSG